MYNTAHKVLTPEAQLVKSHLK